MALAADDDRVLRQRTVFLSLLPPTRTEWRVAMLAIIGLAVAFIALVPYAKVPLAPLPPFIPTYQSALLVCDLLTAAVIFGQFSVQRTRGLLILATAYLFTASAIIPHTLSFPGLFAPGGAIGGGAQTTVWLYMLWHAAFPLLVAVYALVKEDERALPAGSPWVVAAPALAIVTVLAGTAMTTAGHAQLPTLLKPDNTYTVAMYVVVTTVWALNIVALALLLLRPPYRALDLWLMVVMVAWIGDVGLSATFNEKRFDVGFYFGRAYGLVAASFVLVMLLLETRALYTRLARTLAQARDAAMQQAQHSQELYRTLFEMSPYATAVTDLETRRVLAANYAAAEQYGWPLEEFLNLQIREFVAPKDLPKVMAQRTQIAHAAGGRMEGVHHRKRDGTIIEVDVVSRPIDFAGRPALLSISTDVGKQRQAERQARRVFETSRDLILVTDSYGTVTQISPSCLKTIGFTSEEMIGRNGVDFVLPDDLETTRQEMREARRGSAIRQFKCRYLHKDGRAVTLQWNGLWSEPDHRYFFIGRDMTELEAKEAQLRQAQKMEAVGQLTGGVAHDFNNILMVIQANVEELLEEGPLTPDQRERLSAIATSGDRAAEMTRRLLAFSRKQRLQPQPTNLTDLVAGIDKLLRRTLGQRIQIESALADDLWTTEVDRSQLESALVNLCVNSRDAMPDGGRLLIETANAMLDDDYAADNPGAVAGQYVMLAVTDTGTGIPPEHLGKVFEPFFTTKEVGKGTGLGLSMVFGFIKQSNGHIKVYSEVDRGTTIRMYLPRSDAPLEAESAGPLELPLGAERVLLVEDEEHVRATVARQLRSLGYTVTEAAGGSAALEILEGQKFDLLLTDVIMPIIDGPTLAKATVGRWPDTRVLFMSGYSERGARNYGVVGMQAHLLSKPFRKIDLARRVRETLDE